MEKQKLKFNSQVQQQQKKSPVFNKLALLFCQGKFNSCPLFVFDFLTCNTLFQNPKDGLFCCRYSEKAHLVEISQREINFSHVKQLIMTKWKVKPERFLTS